MSDYSFIVLDSVSKYKEFKSELVQLDSEYASWNISTFNDFNPNYKNIIENAFKLNIDELLQKLNREKESGIPEKDTDEKNIRYFTTGNFLVVLIRNSTEFIGKMAFLTKNEQMGLLSSVYIKPANRGNGLGLMLFNKIKDLAREKEIKKIYLETFPFMKSAIKLYKRAGFRECDHYSFVGHSRETGVVLESIYMELELE